MAGIYSNNIVDNPSAETGDLTGWSSSGDGSISVVNGGVSGTKCFYIETGIELNAETKMQQNVIGVNPTSGFKVGVKFLPEYPPINTEVHSFATLQINYIDGSKDIIKMPLRRDVNNE